MLFVWSCCFPTLDVLCGYLLFCLLLSYTCIYRCAVFDIKPVSAVQVVDLLLDFLVNCVFPWFLGKSDDKKNVIWFDYGRLFDVSEASIPESELRSHPDWLIHSTPLPPKPRLSQGLNSASSQRHSQSPERKQSLSIIRVSLFFVHMWFWFCHEAKCFLWRLWSAARPSSCSPWSCMPASLLSYFLQHGRWSLLTKDCSHCPTLTLPSWWKEEACRSRSWCTLNLGVFCCGLTGKDGCLIHISAF